jgi:hypothetical protein
MRQHTALTICDPLDSGREAIVDLVTQNYIEHDPFSVRVKVATAP